MRHQLRYWIDDDHRAEYERLVGRFQAHARDGYADAYTRAFTYLLATDPHIIERVEPHINFAAGEVPSIDTLREKARIGVLSGGEQRVLATALHLWNYSNEFAVAEHLRGLDPDRLRACLHAIEHLASNIN